MPHIKVNCEIYDADTNTSDVFDISTLCNSISIDGYLDGQPGKITCTIQKDPRGQLGLRNGSIITVIADEVPMFYGYIFTMGMDATETFKITAYDQLRYLKNNDIIETKNQTASQIFEMICKRTELNYKIEHPSSFIASKYQHINKAYYSMISYGIEQTLINTNEYYFIRDEFGTLTFCDLSKKLTDLIIGDKSLLTSYQYEISIDNDTANRIRVYKTDEESGQLQTWEYKDSRNIRRWGQLVLLEEAGKEMNEAQIQQLASQLLQLKNRETKTMKLNAIGIPSLKAGDGFRLSIDALGIKENMWIESITHTLTKNTHFMQLGVFI